MSAATPARWFCETHEELGSNNDLCWIGVQRPFAVACEMVLVRLVDPSALVVERDADGNWPAELVDPDGPLWWYCGGDGPDLLDNLAAWARGEAST